jgi:hypothetical protein
MTACHTCVTPNSIDLTAGVAVLVDLHASKSDGKFSDGLELIADDKQVFSYEVVSDKPSNDSSTDPLYTSYLFFGPTAGKTTLRITPSAYARDTLRDSGEIDFAVTVTDQKKP